ncbi:MAG: putative UbiX-like flavin prenyltransferase [Chlamydiales bacterium]|nr:putative UbiX-like flavin prenyltransferase [Chlamydiales bacterium]
MGRYVVGVSGASGIILALHTLRALTQGGHHVELTMSQYALYTASLELGKEYASPTKLISHLEKPELVTVHANQDVGCAIASGSFVTDGMIVIPCSVTTLAAISVGLGDNALRRAADVTLKERRPLILVPREAPFSEIHLENMLKLSRAGATIIPPVPAWYTKPQSLEDVERFIVGKILDSLHLTHSLYPRWKSVD